MAGVDLITEGALKSLLGFGAGKEAGFETGPTRLGTPLQFQLAISMPSQASTTASHAREFDLAIYVL